MKLTITAFQVNFGDGPKEYLTCVDIERLTKGRYVLDERSPKRVEGQEWIVRSDDVIGEFDVKDGEVVPGSYRPNRDFALVNEEGLFQLTDEIAESVMVAIDSLPDPEDPTPSWDFALLN